MHSRLDYFFKPQYGSHLFRTGMVDLTSKGISEVGHICKTQKGPPVYRADCGFLSRVVVSNFLRF